MADQGVVQEMGEHRWERTVLTRAPAMSRWMTSQSAQNVTVTPARAGPELLAGHRQVTDTGTTRSNSTGARLEEPAAY